MKLSIYDAIKLTENQLVERFTILASKLNLGMFFHKDKYTLIVGTQPTVLVAHLDTVRGKDKCKPYVTNSIMRNAGGVLGADDRAGVYSLYRLLEICAEDNIPFPSVLLTFDEECGGLGVKQLIKDFNKEFPTPCNLFVELDRSGANDYVYYSGHIPNEIKDYVESYGFVESHGSYSDIADLTNHYEIPSVNLSIGYYYQHTQKERLHIDEMNLTVRRVAQMLRNPVTKLYPVDSTRNRRFNYYDLSYEKDWDFSHTKKVVDVNWDVNFTEQGELLDNYDEYLKSYLSNEYQEYLCSDSDEFTAELYSQLFDATYDQPNYQIFDTTFWKVYKMFYGDSILTKNLKW